MGTGDITQKAEVGTSLVVQWLRLCTPNAGVPGSIPGQGTRSHMLQLKVLHAATKWRETLMSVTANQAIRNDDGQVIGFRFEKCKGGKTGCVLVLPDQREKMTSFVDNKIATAGQNARLISSVSRNANPHYERGNYAQALYSCLKEAKDNGIDLYEGRRSLFINQAKYEQALSHPRYSAPTVRGYDTAVLAELAQHLLHYRISSTLIYLDRDSE